MTVRAVMTADVHAVRPEVTFKDVQAADVRAQHLVDYERGRLTGIAARRDLLRALARPDDEIAQDVEERLRTDPNRPDDSHVRCTVDGGGVTVTGDVRYEWDAPILVGIVRGIEGVVDVVNELHHREPRPVVSTRARVLSASSSVAGHRQGA